LKGDKGDPGNGWQNGTIKNQIMYWNGAAWTTLDPGMINQVLTVCNGLITWTDGGKCPPIITALNCAGATNEGTLTQGIFTEFFSYIPYTGGNGGIYPQQIVNSTGVTGLQAIRSAGTLEVGSGNVSYVIEGTPASSGTASFLISLGGQSCTLTIPVNILAASLTTINCGDATNNGTLTQGIAASGVSSVISYTGGNGGIYTGQSVASTGVAGLTATLTGGTLASGNGNVTYTITGTPSSSGSASFTISLGGKSCTLTSTVYASGTVSGITAHRCGSANVHNSTLPYGTMTDQEGNQYRTIQIGNQIWMAENLRTTKYSNAISIANIVDNTLWESNTTGAYCSYNNTPANDCPYGKLYNWYAVNNINKICPAGWHVPTDAEFTTLSTFLGGEITAGGKMKSTGTFYWVSPNTNAINSSGFSALPSGSRGTNGVFGGIGSNASFWSNTASSTTNAWYRFIGNLFGDLIRPNDNKAAGRSIRCVKD
jgi:uncharacterized protein (TIGR02145 family)